MIIAITGGSGFIGRNLVSSHIEQGDEVRLLSRKKILNDSYIKYFVGDLSNPDVDLSNFLESVDILYHCAGEVNNESLMQELHINGTQRLVDAALGRVGRWVQLSSVGVYGKCRSSVMTESSKEHPVGVYEITKAESDKVIRTSGIPYVIVRPSNVFGNDMNNQSLRRLLKTVRKGLFFFIGSPGSLVNYVHVKDVVKYLMLCGVKDNVLGETFIISQTIKIEQMIESFQYELIKQKNFFRFPEGIIRALLKVLKFLNISIPLTPSRVDALTSRCIYNSNKAHEVLGFGYSMTLQKDFKLFAKKN